MDSRHRGHSTRTRPKQARKSRPDPTPNERGNSLIAPLTGIANRLTYIRATAVTVELALRAQNGDQDVDIAACMRAGVCDALDDQFTRLKAIIESLGGSLAMPSE